MKKISPDTDGVEATPRRRLTEEDVRVVRERLARGDRQVDIAADMKMSQQNVSAINRGLTWRGVEVDHV